MFSLYAKYTYNVLAPKDQLQEDKSMAHTNDCVYKLCPLHWKLIAGCVDGMRWSWVGWGGVNLGGDGRIGSGMGWD